MDDLAYWLLVGAVIFAASLVASLIIGRFIRVGKQGDDDQEPPA